jgi:hypothetical protein
MRPFENGALVFRMWDDGSGECVGSFQYMHDAVLFAETKMLAGDSPYTSNYVAINIFDGECAGFPVNHAEEESV